jgi:hypothetical protein
MPAWFGTGLVLIIVAVLAFLAARSLWRTHKNGGGCGGDCSCCGGCSGCSGSCSACQQPTKKVIRNKAK